MSNDKPTVKIGTPITNAERAARAYELIKGYCGEPGDECADVAYFIADLMHWADIHNSTHVETARNVLNHLAESQHVWPFADLVGWAAEHYDEERNGATLTSGTYSRGGK